MSSPSAIITGAASGIGLALSKAFLLKGYHVVMADIHPPGDSLATSLGENALFIQTDTSDWESQRNLFQKAFSWRTATMLFANAGIIGTDPSFLQSLTTPSSTNPPQKPPLPTIAVNLLGTIYSIQLFTSFFLTHHSLKPSSPNNGSITLTASQAALYTLPLDPIYGATKSALVALTRSLAPTLTPSNVTINAILPGLVPTAISNSLSRITSGDYCVYSWTYFGGIDNAYPFPETLALSDGTSPLLPITPAKYINPQSTIVQAATDLTNGMQTGQTVECSGTELFYRKQQEYPNEVARWVWEDAPAM